MKTRAYNFIDLTNLIFGNLQVVEFSHIKNKAAFWKCNCSCGNVTIVTGVSLRKGHTKSCGCLRHRKIPKGLSSLNRIYKQYQRGAKDRSHSFNLSIDEFSAITKKNCHYCNSIPAKVQRNRCAGITEEAQEYGKYQYNGLDRINNLIGYEPSNVVPCCFICNRAKSDLTYEAFIEYIKRIELQGKNRT